MSEPDTRLTGIMALIVFGLMFDEDARPTPTDEADEDDSNPPTSLSG